MHGFPTREPFGIALLAFLMFAAGSIWARFFWPPEGIIIVGYGLWGLKAVRFLVPTERGFRIFLWGTCSCWYGLWFVYIPFGGWFALIIPVLGPAMLCWIVIMFPLSLVLLFRDIAE